MKCCYIIIGGTRVLGIGGPFCAPRKAKALPAMHSATNAATHPMTMNVVTQVTTGGFGASKVTAADGWMAVCWCVE